MRLYFEIQYTDKDGTSRHSDQCMREMDRKFLHDLLDEYLDNFPQQKIDDKSHLIFEVCEGHVDEEESLIPCSY